MITPASAGRRVRRLLPGLTLLATASALAQVAPQPPATAKVEDETITLSPFVISTERDIGWTASDTLSATRTKQALKEVPVAIDAITSDFLDDLGLFTVDEATAFVANAYAPPTLENDSQSGAIAFRGLSGSTATRNYFRWYIPSDNYNVERIDFGKGSNSLIFGDVEPGGQASVFTKRALMKNFGEVFAYANHYGAYRVQVDYNRRIGNKVAFRFNAVEREERTFQDASTFGLSGQTLTTTIQPFKTTMVRLEYERGDFGGEGCLQTVAPHQALEIAVLAAGLAEQVTIGALELAILALAKDRPAHEGQEIGLPPLEATAQGCPGFVRTDGAPQHTGKGPEKPRAVGDISKRRDVAQVAEHQIGPL